MPVTYQDVLDRLVDYLGGNPAEAVQRDCRRAIQEAYRDVAAAHTWTYLLRHGRIVTNAPASAGTIAYQHSSGSVPRLVTLTGGTWPAWAAGGYLRVGTVAYRVASVVNATQLTLEEEVNPGQDLPAGTAYTLYQDTYPLPADFVAADRASYELNFGGMEYVHPRTWLFENRYVFAEGVPRCYTFTGDRQYPGRMVIRLLPVPTEVRSIDFIYLRQPRPLRVAKVGVGQAVVTAGVASVFGPGATWTPDLVGSVFRLGTPSLMPTGPEGLNPAVFETMIVGYQDAADLTLADPAPATLPASPYVISDPVDLEPGAMLTAFLRAAEARLAVLRNAESKADALALAAQALREAKATDSRSFQGRSAGHQAPLRQRLRDMPIDLSEAASLA
jgi:hypothetical protein